MLCGVWLADRFIRVGRRVSLGKRIVHKNSFAKSSVERVADRRFRDSRLCSRRRAGSSSAGCTPHAAYAGDAASPEGSRCNPPARANRCAARCDNDIPGLRPAKDHSR
jgi:hypothetical protein